MDIRVFVENRLAEVRWALRSLARSPGTSALAVLSLALGIGANTAIFSLVNAVLLKMLPVPSPQELFLVASGPNGPRVSWNYPDYLAFRDRTTGFSGLAAGSGVGQLGLQVAEGGTPGPAELVQNQYVSGNYFEVLGARPALGRLFNPGDDKTFGGAPYAVLGYECWNARFAASPSRHRQDNPAQRLSAHGHRRRATRLQGDRPDDCGGDLRSHGHAHRSPARAAGNLEHAPLLVVPRGRPRARRDAHEADRSAAYERLPRPGGRGAQGESAGRAGECQGDRVPHPRGTRLVARAHHAPRAAHGSDGRRRLRAADCVRQRRQHHGRARSRPAARDRDSPRGWRRTCAHCRAARDRERRHRGARRDRRNRARLCRHPPRPRRVRAARGVRSMSRRISRFSRSRLAYRSSRGYSRESPRASRRPARTSCRR